MVIVSHPTGNANLRAAAEGLVSEGLLERFFTCVALFKSSPYYSFTRLGPLREFRKRTFSESLKPYTYSRPYRELTRLARQRLGRKQWMVPYGRNCSIDEVYSDLDLFVAGNLGKAKAVYAYEDGALQTFQEAKSRGLHCLYDLPIGYWKALRTYLQEEARIRPEWAGTIRGLHDTEEKLLKKDAELRLADRIFVASSFTAQTLEMFQGNLAPIHVIPYGFPPVTEEKSWSVPTGRPIKILFVGGLSQRKGISFLFEAVQKMGVRLELTVVGKKVVDDCEVLNRQLGNHTWIPALPHHRIIELMRSQDLLVFPSLFEGFGLVVTEAMSQGTPVITTDRTCGPDLIRPGENGWIIEAGSTEALCNQLEEILMHPEVLVQNGKVALETARKRPWETYSIEMAKTITAALKI